MRGLKYKSTHRWVVWRPAFPTTAQEFRFISRQVLPTLRFTAQIKTTCFDIFWHDHNPGSNLLVVLGQRTPLRYWLGVNIELSVDFTAGFSFAAGKAVLISCCRVTVYDPFAQTGELNGSIVHPSMTAFWMAPTNDFRSGRVIIFVAFDIITPSRKYQVIPEFHVQDT